MKARKAYTLKELDALLDDDDTINAETDRLLATLRSLVKVTDGQREGLDNERGQRQRLSRSLEQADEHLAEKLEVVRRRLNDGYRTQNGRLDDIDGRVRKIREELGEAPAYSYASTRRIWDRLGEDAHMARAAFVEDGLVPRDLLTLGDELAQACLLFERGLAPAKNLEALRDLVAEWHRARAQELRP